MNTTNKILDELYFITTTVVDWIDIFTRPQYKHIILDALTYCQQNKGLKIYAWVLMSNHLHAIVSAGDEPRVSDIIRDFKKFTSKQILNQLKTDTQESRRQWMMDHFNFTPNSKGITRHSFWQEGYYPELISTYDFYKQKLNYIHDNPVKQEIVSKQEEYRYSSAIDYAGGKGLLNINIVD